MSLEISCPHCNAQLELTLDLLGMNLPCPNCQNIIHVPKEADKKKPAGDFIDRDLVSNQIPRKNAINRGSRRTASMQVESQKKSKKLIRIFILVIAIVAIVYFIQLALQKSVERSKMADAVVQINKGIPEQVDEMTVFKGATFDGDLLTMNYTITKKLSRVEQRAAHYKAIGKVEDAYGRDIPLLFKNGWDIKVVYSDESDKHLFTVYIRAEDYRKYDEELYKARDPFMPTLEFPNKPWHVECDKMYRDIKNDIQ